MTRFFVGALGLKEARRVMAEATKRQWSDTGAQPRSGRAKLGVVPMWLQCEDRPVKRLMVCRRWMNDGEFLWNSAAVVTNFAPSDARVTRLIKRRGLGFEDTIWSLYSCKAGMEKRWKNLLSDLGLRHPPSAKAAANIVFYALAGLAYNLTCGVRRWGFDGQRRTMRLWRLRSEFLALVAYAVHHGRTVLMRLVYASDRLIEGLLPEMGRLARL